MVTQKPVFLSELVLPEIRCRAVIEPMTQTKLIQNIGSQISII